MPNSSKKRPGYLKGAVQKTPFVLFSFTTQWLQKILPTISNSRSTCTSAPGFQFNKTFSLKGDDQITKKIYNMVWLKLGFKGQKKKKNFHFGIMIDLFKEKLHYILLRELPSFRCLLWATLFNLGSYLGTAPQQTIRDFSTLSERHIVLCGIRRRERGQKIFEKGGNGCAYST